MTARKGNLVAAIPVWPDSRNGGWEPRSLFQQAHRPRRAKATWLKSSSAEARRGHRGNERALRCPTRVGTERKLAPARPFGLRPTSPTETGSHHKRSADGGLTWSPAERLAAGLPGEWAVNAVAEDASRAIALLSRGDTIHATVRQTPATKPAGR